MLTFKINGKAAAPAAYAADVAGADGACESPPCAGGSSGTSAAKQGEAVLARSPQVLEQQAAMILSAMDAAAEGRSLKPGVYSRRQSGVKRLKWRVPAQLRLFADGAGAESWTIFSRDAEPRALGFISPERLPLGYGGRLIIPAPDGSTLEVDVTLMRCRSSYGGWYEGALYFNPPQPVFGQRVDCAS